MASGKQNMSEKSIRPLPSDAEGEGSYGLKLTIGDFSGPMDLLCYLIEKNEIDLFDIPIASLTAQYLSFMESIDSVDLEMASDFLLMGAGLLELKTRMMLPKVDEAGKEADPRDELVLRLLAYRRCKLIAAGLEQRALDYAGVRFRLPAGFDSLGMEAPDPQTLYADESEFRPLRFEQAAKQVEERNQARFQDLHEKMNYIVSRERFSLKAWIGKMWDSLKVSAQLSFNKMFPKSSGRRERLTAFLALLELLKQNRVRISQERAFGDITISRREGNEDV